MKRYDLIVLGSGAGLIVVEYARAHGFSVALIEKGKLGGTCLNVGCIPSKLLLYPAHRIADIREAAALGVTAAITHIDFSAIMERTRSSVGKGEAQIRRALKSFRGVDLYKGEAQFTGDSLLVGEKRLSGDRIVIATGARPHIPDIPGLREAGCLTNDTLLDLTRKPESMIIIGGGYVAAEYAHFFSSVGVSVILLQKNPRLLPEEEPEISALLKKEMSRNMQVVTGMEAVSVRRAGNESVITGRDTRTGDTREFKAEVILAGTGRTSNSDRLNTAAAGIETDQRNYIRVNRYFETSRRNVWAFGDAIGRKMFRHVANREAGIVWNNIAHGAKESLDYRSAPHAVFCRPEIASVGLTEREALEEYGPDGILVGRAAFADVARGEAMRDDTSFAKAIVRSSDSRILGFHIIGPSASVLIQEVVNAMANKQTVGEFARGMRIHPALSEVVLAAFGRLREV